MKLKNDGNYHCQTKFPNIDIRENKMDFSLECYEKSNFQCGAIGTLIAYIFFIFLYWFLLIPLGYIYIYEEFNSSLYIIYFWIIGFVLWCLIMLTTLFIIFNFNKKKEQQKLDLTSPLNNTEEFIKTGELKEHVKKKLGLLESEDSSEDFFRQKSIHNKKVEKSFKDSLQVEKPGLLSRLSTRRKKETLSPGPEIIDLPDFNPDQRIFRLSTAEVHKLDDLQDLGEPTETVRTKSPIPFDEHLHIVQIESPSTPKSPEKKTNLKSPREIFFQDLRGNESTLFDFDLKEDEKVKHVFLGEIGRQESLTSEIFIPINQNGGIKETVEIGKYEILKEDN